MTEVERVQIKREVPDPDYESGGSKGSSDDDKNDSLDENSRMLKEELMKQAELMMAAGIPITSQNAKAMGLPKNFPFINGQMAGGASRMPSADNTVLVVPQPFSTLMYYRPTFPPGGAAIPTTSQAAATSGYQALDLSKGSASATAGSKSSQEAVDTNNIPYDSKERRKWQDAKKNEDELGDDSFAEDESVYGGDDDDIGGGKRKENRIRHTGNMGKIKHFIIMHVVM